MRKLFFLSSFLLSLGLAQGSASAADAPKAYEFNVYASGNIGSQSNPYGSDYQGIAGSGGNAYFGNFSLNALQPFSSPYSLYTGGSASINSGMLYQGIQAQGNVYLNSAAVQGNISAGGNLQGGTGTVSGNVTLGGSNTSLLTITGGSVSSNQAFTPLINTANLTQYFNSASSYWGGLPPTATWNNVYGQIQVSNLQSGRNIVNLSLADLSNSYGIKLNGPSDAFVIFNIADNASSPANLKDITFNLNNGLTKNNVLFNLTNASALNLQGGGYLSLLAPKAAVTFSSGLLTGNLVAKDLFGSGQVNTGSFVGFAADESLFAVSTPEPSTYLLMGSFLLLLVFFGRKKHLNASMKP